MESSGVKSIKIINRFKYEVKQHLISALHARENKIYLISECIRMLDILSRKEQTPISHNQES